MTSFKFVALLGSPSSPFTAPLSIDAYLNHNYRVEESSSMIRVIHPGVLDDIFELRRKMNDKKLFEYCGYDMGWKIR